MSNYNEPPFEEFEEEVISPNQPKSSNRTFLIVIGILGAIFVISLIAVVAFALVVLPQRNQARRDQAAQINAQNTATSLAATQVAFLVEQEPTITETQPGPLDTSEPPPTSVVVFATQTPVPTETTTPTQGPQMALDDAARTATVGALLTQAAGGGGGTPIATSTLPKTGFADEVGLPGLLAAAVLLLGVIFLVRRMRLSGNQ
jgi:LPXTG-motif cell wall-anchored protein